MKISVPQPGTWVLVTGGAGWIGAALARRLVAAGWSVRVLDDLSRGDPRRLDGLDVDLRVGDVRSERTVREAVSGVAAVVHLASPPPSPRTWRDQRTAHDVAVSGTLNLLGAACDARVARLVFASSAAVYGVRNALALHEDLPPQPISMEGALKLAAEAYVRLFNRGGLETCVLRLFSVYGPAQPAGEDGAFVARFIEQARLHQPLTIHGDGSQTRDLVHVDDACSALSAAITAPGAHGRVFNVASGEATPVRRVAALIADLAGGKLPPTRWLTPRPGDPREVRASVAAASSGLGWRAKIRLRDGLAACLEVDPNAPSWGSRRFAFGAHTVPSGAHTVPSGAHTVPSGAHAVPSGAHTVPSGAHESHFATHTPPSRTHSPHFNSHTPLTQPHIQRPAARLPLFANRPPSWQLPELP